MDTNRKWKRHNRLDGILNVLLIVLALSVLGVSSIEMQIDAAAPGTSTQST